MASGLNHHREFYMRAFALLSIIKLLFPAPNPR